MSGTRAWLSSARKGLFYCPASKTLRCSWCTRRASRIPGLFCTEQIFILHNIIEQCVEFQCPLVVNFIAFEKAFDSVHHDSLWKTCLAYGIPQRSVNVFKNIYHNSWCCMQTDTGTSEFFVIMARAYFVIHVVPTSHRYHAEDSKWNECGISWTDQTRLADLDFADDIVDIVLLAEHPVLAHNSRCTSICPQCHR